MQTAWFSLDVLHISSAFTTPAYTNIQFHNGPFSVHVFLKLVYVVLHLFCLVVLVLCTTFMNMYKTHHGLSLNE